MKSFYEQSLDCIRCGLCLETCPTYRLFGRESAGPRGRVHLMRAAEEQRIELDRSFKESMELCLVCRNCESVCPAGVEYEALMGRTRERLAVELPPGPLARLARWIGFGVVLPSRRWLSCAATALGLAQRLGLVRLLVPLAGARGRALAELPRVPGRSQRRPLPERWPAQEPADERASMLAGCVMPLLYGRVNRAAARCLAAVGTEVTTPADHACCGALHAHNGDLEGARRLARETIAAFEGRPGPVVVASAGCGAHMKSYGELLADDPEWAERARTFAARVVDFGEYLAQPARLERLGAALAPTDLGPAAWDAPCHLCHGQGVREQPLVLMATLPGLERVELARPESCCGSAGVYSLLRPDTGRAILDARLDELEASGARVLVTANPGCHLSWETGVRRRGLAVEVLHLAEVLARSLPE